MDKFEIQNEQYHFPYHYIPSYKGDSFERERTLWWGGNIYHI